MDSREILSGKRSLVCVVRYHVPRNEARSQAMYNLSPPPANPSVLHQICLVPGKVSGDLVRVGETSGDELSGWQWIDALEVVRVLGVLGEDGITVTPCE